MSFGAGAALAFIPLLLRPAALFWGCWWLVFTVSAAMLAEPSLLVLAFLTSLPSGLLAGQTVQELQHTTFAWTLPRLRAWLAAAVVAIGVGVGALGALLIQALPSFAPADFPLAPLPFFALALFGFGLGLVLRDPLRRQLSIVPVGAGCLVVLWAYPTLRLGPLGGLGVTLAALAGAALCFYRAFAADTFRRKPFVPTLSLVSAALAPAAERYRKEKLAAAPEAAGVEVELSGTGLRRWIGAAVRERHGFRRLGWWAPLFGSALLGGAVQLVWADAGIRSWSEVAKGVRSTLVALPAPAAGLRWAGDNFTAALPLGFTLVIAMHFASVGLDPRLNYPLPRNRRSRAIYLAHLGALSAVAFVVALVFGGLAAWGEIAAEPTSVGGRVPSFIPSLVTLLAVAPALQWMSSRLELPAVQRRSPSLAQLAAVAAVVVMTGAAFAMSAVWSASLASAHPVLQITLLASLLAASQGLYWLHLRRHHERGDLV